MKIIHEVQRLGAYLSLYPETAGHTSTVVFPTWVPPRYMKQIPYRKNILKHSFTDVPLNTFFIQNSMIDQPSCSKKLLLAQKLTQIKGTRRVLPAGPGQQLHAITLIARSRVITIFSRSDLSRTEGRFTFVHKGKGLANCEQLSSYHENRCLHRRTLSPWSSGMRPSEHKIVYNPLPIDLLQHGDVHPNPGPPLLCNFCLAEPANLACNRCYQELSCSDCRHLLQLHANAETCNSDMSSRQPTRLAARNFTFLQPFSPSILNPRQSRTLSIISLNVNGNLINKSSNVIDLLNDTKADIALFQETYVTSPIQKITISSLFPEYHFHFNCLSDHKPDSGSAKNRSSRGTGLALAIHKDLAGHFQHHKISKRHSTLTTPGLTIHNVYLRPGQTHTKGRLGVIESVLKQKILSPDTTHIIAGDWNFTSAPLDSLGTSSRDKKLTDYLNRAHLIDIYRVMYPLGNEKTFRSPSGAESRLDRFYTNDPEIVSNTHPLSQFYQISDHFPVILQTCLTLEKCEFPTPENQTAPLLRAHFRSQEICEAFNQQLSDSPIPQTLDTLTSSIETAYKTALNTTHTSKERTSESSLENQRIHRLKNRLQTLAHIEAVTSLQIKDEQPKLALKINNILRHYSLKKYKDILKNTNYTTLRCELRQDKNRVRASISTHIAKLKRLKIEAAVSKATGEYSAYTIRQILQSNPKRKVKHPITVYDAEGKPNSSYEVVNQTLVSTLSDLYSDTKTKQDSVPPPLAGENAQCPACLNEISNAYSKGKLAVSRKKFAMEIKTLKRKNTPATEIEAKMIQNTKALARQQKKLDGIECKKCHRLFHRHEDCADRPSGQYFHCISCKVSNSPEEFLTGNKHQILSDKKIMYPITESELAANLAKTNNNIATHKIPYEALKALNQDNQKILLDCLNQVIETGDIPSIGKRGISSQIYKGQGDPYLQSNQRNVTVTEATFQLLIKILSARLQEEIINSGLISASQTGFLKGRNSADQASYVHAIIQHAIQHQSHLEMCFADITKAFDKVSHSRLWETLRFYGIDPEYINFLQQLYTQGKLQVRLPSLGLSDEIIPTAGVRQGAADSPLLFIIYLQPLLDKLEQLGVGYELPYTMANQAAHADDLTIMTANSTDMRTAYQLFQRWHMQAP